MNYIRQLNAVMIRFSEDNRLTPAHISMYLALFQMWNLNRFRNPTSINRSEAMNLSRIGSVGTYHKCIRQLDEWGYLKYIPSYNPLRGSVVHMFRFDTGKRTTEGQPTDQLVKQDEEQLVGQLIEPLINREKKNKQQTNKKETAFVPPGRDEVKAYFIEQQSDGNEAECFFDHFESNGWLVGGRSKMRNWKAAARNWIKRSSQFSQKGKNNLHARTDKDYTIPL